MVTFAVWTKQKNMQAQGHKLKEAANLVQAHMLNLPSGFLHYYCNTKIEIHTFLSPSKQKQSAHLQLNLYNINNNLTISTVLFLLLLI